MSSFLYNKIIAQRPSFVKFPLQHFACSSGNTAKNRKKERPMCVRAFRFVCRACLSVHFLTAGGAKACSGEGPGIGLFVQGPSFRAVSLPVSSRSATKKPAAPLACGFLVPVTGIEPVRCFHRQILSLLRLPISSHRQILAHLVYHSPQENAREAQRNQAALGNMIQLRGAAPQRALGTFARSKVPFSPDYACR